MPPFKEYFSGLKKDQENLINIWFETQNKHWKRKEPLKKLVRLRVFLSNVIM